MNKRSLLSIALLSLFLTSVLLSCDGDETIKEIEKKGETVYDTVGASDRTISRILEYNVVNTRETIYSAVDHDAKVITVYLPHYVQMEVIEPEIVLAEGATVMPESGEIVDVFGDTMEYTVTGKDGSKTVYTLEIIIQQPDLEVAELSTAETPASFVRSWSTVIDIAGENFIPNLELTRFYLIGSDGTEHVLQNYSVNSISAKVIVGESLAPLLTVDTEYWIEVRSYNLVERMELPITFVNPPASIDLQFGHTRKQGETFTIAGSYINSFTLFAIRVNATDYVPMVIESVTENLVTIRIPDDFPAGTYTSPLMVQYELDGTLTETMAYAASIQVDPQ